MKPLRLAIVTASAVVVALGLGIGVTEAGAQQVGVQVLPMKGPPGAPVSIQVSNCPAGTATIAVRPERPTGSPDTPPPFDPNETLTKVAADSTGSATVATNIEPVLKPEGQYTFDVFCLDANGAVVGSPLSTQFELAALPLQVTPNQGTIGTHVTVTGSGCPQGTTDQVLVRISGASDQLSPFDPNSPNLFPTSVNADGSFSVAFDIPAGLERGENQVESFCISEGGSNLAGPGLTVFVVDQVKAQSDLPPTGADARVLLVGVGLMLVGALSLVARSRSEEAFGRARERGDAR
jgi:hypothetical protein